MTERDREQDRGHDEDTVDLLNEVLDRLLVGPDGVSAGTVDDLELRTRADGGLEVAALLVGTAALQNRLHGWPRRLIRLVAGRVPARRVPIEDVTEIGVDLRLTDRGTETASSPAERWVRERVIERVPGAGHASE